MSAFNRTTDNETDGMKLDLLNHQFLFRCQVKCFFFFFGVTGAEESDADDDRADDGKTSICRKSVRFNDTQGRGDVSKLDCDCEGATKGAAPAPTAGASNDPDTLHASDLEVDETDAEFTIDGAMMERLVLEGAAGGVEEGASEVPCQQLSPDVSIVRQESSAVPARDDPDFDDDDDIVEIGSSESYDDLRICAQPRAGVASVADMNGDIQYSSQHLRRKMGQVESKTSHVHAIANGECPAIFIPFAVTYCLILWSGFDQL